MVIFIYKSWFRTKFSLDMGHFYINDSRSIVISSHAFVKTLSNTKDCLKWQALIASTSRGYQVRIAFNQPVFGNREEYLEIGDGLYQGEETRLTRFNGSALPNDVISVTNAAWINVISPCTNEGTLIMNITINRQTDSGILKHLLDTACLLPKTYTQTNKQTKCTSLTSSYYKSARIMLPIITI